MDPHPWNAITGGLGVVGGGWGVGGGGWPRLNSDPWIPAVALQLSVHLVPEPQFPAWEAESRHLPDFGAESRAGRCQAAVSWLKSPDVGFLLFLLPLSCLSAWVGRPWTD